MSNFWFNPVHQEKKHDWPRLFSPSRCFRDIHPNKLLSKLVNPLKIRAVGEIPNLHPICRALLWAIPQLVIHHPAGSDVIEHVPHQLTINPFLSVAISMFIHYDPYKRGYTCQLTGG